MKVIDQPVQKKGSKRLIFFRIISLSVPFLLLILIEVILRTLQYGTDSRLFIEYSQDKNYLVLNPDASKKYFTSQKIATTGNIEPFKKHKDVHTLRMFILGESTAIGYPYFHNGSFHRWLQYRLSHTYPGRDFEIINIALTAVNSYTISDFAKQVVDYEPDAVLIYTGHNEYYGALGVGSTQNFGSNPHIVGLILRLRDLRIVQFLGHLYAKLKTADSQSEPEGTRMQRMVAEQEIPFGSTLYQKGVEQFTVNMNAAINVLNQHHIPVLVSNLVSNEADLKPFVSFPVDARRYPSFSRNFDLGQKAFQDHDTLAAFQFLKSADHIFDQNAFCNYYLGRLALGQKDFKMAQHYFSKARDLDGLRFRAPAKFNQILDSLCHVYPAAHLVDTKAIFERFSKNHIIGDELILEHVHPDIKGYALMSEVFYNALKEENILPKNSGNELTLNQLLIQMPVNKVDSLAGLYKVEKLKNSWPFSGTMRARSVPVSTFEERTAYDLANRKSQWPDAMDRLYNYYMDQHELAKARTIVETLILEYPTDTQLYLKSAMLSGELKDEVAAIFNFTKAFRLSPSFDVARYLFVLHLKHDQPDKAIPYLNYAIAHNTSNFDLKPIRNAAEEIISLKRELANDPANPALSQRIAGAYLRMKTPVLLAP
jgi:lysophospholipase L1-like esterase